ncbi:MAG: hypothetical protein ABIJ96_12880 [Elusimicrobiota bacterium]
MADRTVTYRLQVIADKSIPSTFKTFEKQALAVRDRIDKRTKQSADTTGKEAKRAADAEKKEREGILNATITAREKEAKAKEAADNRIVRSQQRTRGIVNREHEAMARAGMRTWEMTRTPLEQYNRQLVQLQTLLRNGRISQETYNRAVLQARDAYAAAGTAGMGAFGTRMLQSLTTLGYALGAPVGILGTLMLIKTEFNSVIEAQRRMKEATLTVAEAQRNARINLQADTQQEQEEFDKRVMELSKRTGATPRDVYNVMSSTLSAKGGLSKEQAFEAAEAAIRFTPFQPEAMVDMAGAVLDVMKMQGGLSAEQSLGFLQAVQAKARIVDPAMMAMHGPKAIGPLVSRGATLQEAGAIFAALTQRMFEQGGRRTGTAAISFGERMEDLPELIQERLVAARKKKAAPELVAQIPELEAGLKAIEGKNFSELMRLIGTSPAMQEAFFHQKFEKKAQEAVESLLIPGYPGTTAMEMYGQFMGPGGIPKAEDSAEAYRRRLAIASGGSLQETAQFARDIEAGKQRLEITNPPAARMSIIYDKFQGILQDTGMPATKSKLESLFARPGGLEGFASAVEQRKAELEHPFASKAAPVKSFFERITPLLPGLERQPEALYREPTSVEAAQATELGNLAEILRTMAADQRAAAAEQTDKLSEVVDAVNVQTQSTEEFTAALMNRFLPSFLQQPVPPGRDVRSRGPGVPSMPRGSR